MALDKHILGALMQEKVEGLSDADKRVALTVYTALAEAVIQHIKDYGSVSVSSNLVSPATTCPAGAGVVTSPSVTGTGTIS
jgi:hypothetical protein